MHLFILSIFKFLNYFLIFFLRWCRVNYFFVLLSMFSNLSLNIYRFWLNFFLIGSLYLFQISFIFTLEPFDSPLQLLESDLTVEGQINYFSKFLNQSLIHIESIVFHELEDVIRAYPSVIMYIQSIQHSLDRVIAVVHKTSSQLDCLHLPGTDFYQKSFKNLELLQNIVWLGHCQLRMFNSLSD